MAALTSLLGDQPLQYDLDVDQGTDYRRSIPVLGLAAEATLAAWTVAGQIWSSEPPGDVLHELDVSLAGTSVLLSIPRTVSDEWDWDLAQYQVDLTTPDQITSTFVEGWVRVEHRPRPSTRVVTRQMLHRHMSEPRWSAVQELEADRVVAAVEADLSAALYGAPITPVPRTETVTVTREGMVATSLPVARLDSLDGVAIVTDVATGLPTNLPTGHTLRGHRLWQATDIGAGAYGVPWWGGPGEVTFTNAPHYTGYPVTLTYLGGWGAEPALVEAILRKAAIRMSGQHADTVVITGLNAQPANQQTRESPNFTDDDMKSLGRFRALGWGGAA